MDGGHLIRDRLGLSGAETNATEPTQAVRDLPAAIRTLLVWVPVLLLLLRSVRVCAAGGECLRVELLATQWLKGVGGG